MTIERWAAFSKRDQLVRIGSEFKQARVSEEAQDTNGVHFILQRSLELIDLSLHDAKWREETHMLLGLRDEVERTYRGESGSTVRRLYELI